MKNFCAICFSCAVSGMSALIFIGALQASSASANEALADSLLPLENRSVDIQGDPELFKSVANQINASYQSTSEESDITDLLGAGFLEGLVDENGEVELPLGITVFDAMGMTSVGFGGSF